MNNSPRALRSPIANDTENFGEIVLPSMKVLPLPIKSVVSAAVSGVVDIPEFQRSFVWKPAQVGELAESICNNYPIGTILCWHNPDYVEARLTVKERQSEWIIDGQQRVTALGFIVGRKPKWYKEKDWKEDFPRYETWVDVTSPPDELIFEARRPNPYGSKKWVSLREICRRKEEDLAEFAFEIKKNLAKKYDRVSTKRIEDLLIRINRLFESIEPDKAYSIQKFVISHDLESVATIFSRLNSGGTPVKETDTILAYIGAHHRGWVKQQFLPFLDHLENDGLELDPSILIRTITAIGVGRTRIKEVPKDWWRDEARFLNAWKRTKAAVSFVLRSLSQNFGILSMDILPTKNALIPLFALYDRYPDKSFNHNKALYWLLLATRAQRYGVSSATALDEDLRALKETKSFPAAIKALVGNLEGADDVIQPRDLREKYTDRFLRLLYYLAVVKRGGVDWLNGIKLGYDMSDSELNKGFQPEWHHYFPRAYLRRNSRKFSNEDVNSFANIVVLGQKANRTISSSSPKDYIDELKISEKLLEQQFIPSDRRYRTFSRFSRFLKLRSQVLAKGMTSYFQSLKR